jgi:hypothetical protein
MSTRITNASNTTMGDTLPTDWFQAYQRLRGEYEKQRLELLNLAQAVLDSGYLITPERWCELRVAAQLSCNREGII